MEMLQLWQATAHWCFCKALWVRGGNINGLQQVSGEAENRGSNGACLLDRRNRRSLIVRKMSRNETKQNKNF